MITKELKLDKNLIKQLKDMDYYQLLELNHQVWCIWRERRKENELKALKELLKKLQPIYKLNPEVLENMEVQYTAYETSETDAKTNMKELMDLVDLEEKTLDLRDLRKQCISDCDPYVENPEMLEDEMLTIYDIPDSIADSLFNGRTYKSFFID